MTRRLRVISGDGGGASPPTYYKPPAPAVIDPKDDKSVEKWSRVLHLSWTELHDAIREYGPVVRDIRRGLRKNQNEAA
jgi:hypothetical protein